MAQDTPPVNLLGKEWPIALPPQFAVREELVIAYVESEGNTSRRLRVCAAIVGICTSIGREAKADYVKARFDVLAYGGAVYGWLRESGAKPSDVAGQAATIYATLADIVFPREGEVKERAGFSEPAADA
jgi:hypothetical protein